MRATAEPSDVYDPLDDQSRVQFSCTGPERQEGGRHPGSRSSAFARCNSNESAGIRTITPSSSLRVMSLSIVS